MPSRRRRPHYSLKTIKAAFAVVGRMNRTMTAAAGAEELGMDEQAVVDVVGGLTVDDFDKSMRSDVDPAIWQDVYKPIVDGRELYVKFTLDSRGELLLISFKENEP
jgi:motility quorum-sensing regulator / GCU-specific mRNA interferase toxin